MPVTPFVPFASVCQATCKFTMDNQQIENVFHFSYGEAAFSDSGSQIADLLAVEWWEQLRPVVVNTMRLNEIYIVDLAAQDAGIYSSTVTLNNTGTSDRDHLPNSAAFCTTFRTAKRGRSYTGRSFLSGIPEDHSNGSYVTLTYANAVVSAYENMRAVAASSGLPLVIASRKGNGQWREFGVATPVTQCVARDLVIDSQRRRTPGRGS